MTAPLKFALVPVEPTERMCGSIEYGAARLICETSKMDREYFLRKAIAASPGNELLERIVTALGEARDLTASVLSEERAKFKGYEHCSDIPDMEAELSRIDAILNELGGGHG